MSTVIRVWHIPQIPMEPFYVPVGSVEEGYVVMKSLADYDLFQHEKNIKPDYSNAQGMQEFNEGEWLDVDIED